MVPGVLDSTHNFAEYYKAALRLDCSWRQDELTWAPPQFTVPGTPADDPDEGALPPNAAAGRDRGIGSSTSVQLCFFACGMCLTYPWNSINAAVSVFTSKLGARPPLSCVQRDMGLGRGGIAWRLRRACACVSDSRFRTQDRPHTF